MIRHLSLIILSCALSAAEYTGRCVAVTDGDTVNVLDANYPYGFTP